MRVEQDFCHLTFNIWIFVFQLDPFSKIARSGLITQMKKKLPKRRVTQPFFIFLGTINATF